MHRTPWTPAFLALTLLLLPSLVEAQAPLPTPAIALGLDPDGHVTVALRGGAADARHHVVVTHVDAAGMTVVDRVATIDVPANATVDILLRGMPRGHVQHLHLLDGSRAVPTLAGRQGEPDAARLLALPLVAGPLEVPAAPRLAPNATLHVPTYAMHEPVGGGVPLVLVTPQGMLIVAHHDDAGAVFVRASRDGGHTFGAPMQATPPRPEDTRRWIVGATGDERAVLVYETGERAEGGAAVWRARVVDPLRNVAEGETSIAPRSDGAAPDLWNPQLVLAPDGTTLLASQDTRAGEIAFWELRAGAFTPAFAAPLSPGVGTVAFRVGIAQTGVIGIVGTYGRTGNELNEPWYMRSTDGGATFTAPVSFGSLFPASNYWIDLASVALDAAGSMHVAGTAYAEPVVEQAEIDGLLLRIPVTGSVTKRSLSDQMPVDHEDAISFTRVLAHGSGVWAFWNGDADAWAMHSTDGALTFAPPVRLRAADDGEPLMQSGATLRPDGRPILTVHDQDLHIATYAVAPLFEPMPVASAGLTIVTTEEPATASPPVDVAEPPVDPPVEPARSAVPPAAVAGAAVAALAAFAAAFRGWLRHLWALALAPLYTRVSKAQVLGHDVRAGIYRYVVEHPGSRLADITRALGLTTTPTVFHLRVLRREGYVTLVREWSRPTYYPTGAAPAFPRETRDVASTIARLLVDTPGMGPAQLAQRLGISRQLARYHLLALEQQGVIRREGDKNGYVVVVRP